MRISTLFAAALMLGGLSVPAVAQDATTDVTVVAVAPTSGIDFDVPPGTITYVRGIALYTKVAGIACLSDYKEEGTMCVIKDECCTANCPKQVVATVVTPPAPPAVIIVPEKAKPKPVVVKKPKAPKKVRPPKKRFTRAAHPPCVSKCVPVTVMGINGGLWETKDPRAAERAAGRPQPRQQARAERQRQPQVRQTHASETRRAGSAEGSFSDMCRGGRC